jgi:hypothetical protein
MKRFSFWVMFAAGVLGSLCRPSAAGAVSMHSAAAVVLAATPARAATPGATVLPPRRLDLQATPPGAATPPGGVDPEDHRRYVVPVLMSALVPGAGEIATGHFWRGLPLVALDVATWLVHADYEKKGRDARDAYEAFADTHWHYDAWQQVLHDYYNDPSYPQYDWYDSTAAYNCTCPYIPVDQDRQHYYENIGKYLYYYGGWEDWEWRDQATSDSRALRSQYGAMRIESNDNFDHGTQMLYVAMATRLISVVQVSWLMRGDLQRTARLEVRPLQSAWRAAGLELTYRY